MHKIGAVIFFIFLTLDISHAGALLRVQEIKAQRQRQAQMQQYQQEQAYLQSQQAGQPQGQTPSQLTYQQQIDQRNQAIAQAIINAHNPAVSGVSPTDRGQVPPGKNPPTFQQQPSPSSGPAEVKDEVDLSEVWKKLDNKSAVWNLLIDDEAKLLTVSEYISRFQRQGVKINLPPAHYVQMIDQAVGQNPQMLERPFGELLQVLAIVDYDFDNGMDKDVLAKKVLGEDGFEKNKRRFSQQR
jgi:hypothetical protein